MTEYIKIEVETTVRGTLRTTMHIPKKIWDDCDANHLWGDRTDKFIRENIDLSGNADFDFDSGDVDVDGVRLVTS